MASSKALLFDLKQSPLDRIKSHIDGYSEEQYKDGEGTFEVSFMRQVTAISATTAPPIFTSSLTITPDICSRRGLLHGAAAALIFDMCTSYALACVAKPGFWEFSGVSQKLEVSYIRPVPVGLEVLCVSEVMSAGKSLALITGKLVRKSDGVILCSCLHNKVAVDLASAVKL